jgi:uncharacterized protein YbjT (DUF2867 family)
LGQEQLWPGAEVAVADALHKEQLREAMQGIDVAYYLIHSLLLGPQDFMAAEIEAARNFREAAEENGVRRIVYLGGLGDARSKLSSHLRSRTQVADELSRGPVPVTILRAAIIIGSGSASYEIIYHLIRRLPVVPIPRWAESLCQPIGIRDVIKYLVGVLEVPETAGQTFDIGGSDVLSYADMLRGFADVLGKRVLFVRSYFFSNIKAYAYVASLLTPVPAPITRSLMEGLRNNVVCENNDIRTYLPFPTLAYREAVSRALARVAEDNVHTRWTSGYPPAHELATRLNDLEESPAYTAHYELSTPKSAPALFQSISRVGGREGWFATNWMWRLRGALDRVLLGVGTSRGRRRQTALTVNDVIDFWRVEELEPDRRLLLRAEMKLPGKAWLEFTIEDKGDLRRLSVRPYYHTHTVFGKLYWYVLLPFHHFIFTDLIEQIERRS